MIRTSPYYFKFNWLVDIGVMLFGSSNVGTWNFTPYYCDNIKEGEEYRRNYAFPQESMRIVFNVSVLSKLNEKPQQNTVFPAQMEVDWVRVYQKKPCNQNINVNNHSIYGRYIFYNDVLYNMIAGKNVNLICNMNIPANFQVKVVAKENITLGEGFNLIVGEGGIFQAENNLNVCNSNKRIFIRDSITNNLEDTIERYVDDDIIVYDESNDFFIYSSLDDDGYIIMDFKDNNISDIYVSITDITNEITYSNKINQPLSSINLSKYTEGNYVLKLTNTKTRTNKMYTLMIKE